MSFRGRRDENQVNIHCCQSAERVHTTTLSFQTESLVDVPACLLLLVKPLVRLVPLRNQHLKPHLEIMSVGVC